MSVKKIHKLKKGCKQIKCKDKRDKKEERGKKEEAVFL